MSNLTAFSDFKDKMESLDCQVIKNTCTIAVLFPGEVGHRIAAEIIKVPGGYNIDMTNGSIVRYSSKTACYKYLMDLVKCENQYMGC